MIQRFNLRSAPVFLLVIFLVGCVLIGCGSVGDQLSANDSAQAPSDRSADQINLVAADLGPAFLLDNEYTNGAQLPEAPFTDALDYNRREFSKGEAHVVYSTVAIYPQLPEVSLVSLLGKVEGELLSEVAPENVFHGAVIPVSLGEEAVMKNFRFRDGVFNANGYVLVFRQGKHFISYAEMDFFNNDDIYFELILARGRLLESLIEADREALGQSS